MFSLRFGTFLEFLWVVWFAPQSIKVRFFPHQAGLRIKMKASSHLSIGTEQPGL